MSPALNENARRRINQAIWLFNGAIVVPVVLAGLATLAFGLKPKQGYAIAVALMLLIGFAELLVIVISRGTVDQTLTELPQWKLEVTLPEGCRPPPFIEWQARNLLSAPRNLPKEDDIRYLARYHWYKVLAKSQRNIIAQALAVGLLLLSSLIFVVYKHSGWYGYHSLRTHTYHHFCPWYAPVLLFLGLALLIMVSVIPALARSVAQWYFSWIMVTGTGLYLFTIPSRLFFYITTAKRRLDLMRIQEVTLQQNWFGKLLNFGNISAIGAEADEVVVDGHLTNLDVYKHIDFVANPDEFRRILDDTRSEVQPAIQSQSPFNHRFIGDQTQPLPPVPPEA